jgi:hypothetical protein
MKPVVVPLLLLGALVACWKETAADSIRVEGTLAIGPLCPVEPCSIPASRLDAIYGAYTLLFRSKATQIVLGKADKIDHTGRFALSLPPGGYRVEYDDGSPSATARLSRIQPQEIEVTTGKSNAFAFTIDTGIR